MSLTQMSLGQLIGALEAAADRADVRVPLGFGNPHSYRGIYNDLAFEPVADVTVGEMLAAARSALGSTYEGWKGGDYKMVAQTDCWLDAEGHGGGQTLGPLLLTLLLAAGQLDDETQAELRAFVPPPPG